MMIDEWYIEIGSEIRVQGIKEIMGLKLV